MDRLEGIYFHVCQEILWCREDRGAIKIALSALAKSSNQSCRSTIF
jgi:hypothetical protein